MIKYLITSLLLLIQIHAAQAMDQDLRAQASFYIDTYGLVDAKTMPLADRANKIFDRIRQIAEEPIDLTPSLRIINSSGRPWAIALPDGYIILSKAAIEICYKNVSPEEGDARLAFVLGHELAHLSTNDFWHRKMYLSLSGEHNEKSLDKIRHAILSAAKAQGATENDWREVIKRKELQADDAGFLYASLAGFRTDQIFSDSDNNRDFLQTWVNQTQTLDDELHFNAKERSAFLRNRFKQIMTQVEYFMSGVRLAHFGQFEDAMHFFEKFQKAFPAHEVLNNLGFVHLQLARKHMPNALRYQYWLPTFMDNAPAFVTRTRTMDTSLSPISLQHLQKSIKYFKKAVSAHSNNRLSLVNLAAAYMYLGEFHNARAYIEQARKLDLKSPSVNEIRALILYEQEKDIDMWPKTMSILKKLADLDIPTAWFNLAQLYESRGRSNEAKTYWQRIIALKDSTPKPIFLIACNKIYSQDICLKDKKDLIDPPFSTNPTVGSNIESATVKNSVKDWQRRREEIGPLTVDMLVSKKGDLYLAIEDNIAIIVVKNHALKSIHQLLKCCGNPQSTHSFGDAEIWSYGQKWSALVEHGTVKEVWLKGI